NDGIFIGIDIDDGACQDAALAAKLAEVCPVDIFKVPAPGQGQGVQIAAENIDECVLCRLCLDAAPDGALKVLKLYDNDALLL
ncbi:MAG: hypothetical protein ACYDA6_11695, partial [Solirubrobacteraceae bacterium]